MMWMVLEECIDFGANTAIARVDLIGNKKSNMSSSGRMFCFWPLNGKYYVSDYTPNDSSRAMSPDSPMLNLNNDEHPMAAREVGYAQNFLEPVI
jgi:hypothetical protein